MNRVGLATIAREWGRLGCIGFGGPPAHIALLRDLCVHRRKWLSEKEFEDGIAVTNLLPGPASTQLAILCAWRLRGAGGALVGGFCFIVPGLVLILALAALFLSAHPPLWVLGAAAGAGAAVPAVAAHAAWGLIPGSWKRVGAGRSARIRWCGYVLVGAVAAAVTGPWLVVVLVVAGLVEVAVRVPSGRAQAVLPVLALPAAVGGLPAVAWVAAKVGALSYGGGFVIIPMMQHDAVTTYGWMTDAQFLDAVALGQITPGPVVQTVAVVGYAAAGLGGGLLAAFVAFAPSFAMIILGGPRLERLRDNAKAQAFLTGAGAAAIGAIAGTTLPLTAALHTPWQYGLLAAAALWLLALRRGVVTALVGAGVIGALITLAG
ncbi:chromate efflux transporter [Actinosynnema sp. NPDC047251]|uniref:Chromate transporter, chromate ion transporter (CHR) family n=1 Tax=Saccharothrix espanaensis (strain ATCC 51144 / DSM 44229 / JCM 9112 / NBRC 15066 / NRRL 15764) TaxID=1179773 RepID=K0K760_SACES|nr:chromate efflux transporter [Saccharothrix espanaensis]CCH32438.1 Chromate transporter, chromate ion transporter (CHR) family [Saccharothrix espanaensis DSM 44229]